MKDRFMVAYRDYIVNNKSKCPHKRKRAKIIPAEVIARRTKALGKIVVRAERRHKPVRISSMNCAELGHFLTSMEQTRVSA